MKADSYTKIGDFCIPVVKAKFATIVQFYGGEHGKREAGDFCFWTLRLKHTVAGERAGKRWLIGRASVYLPPGERFCRIEREATNSRAALVYRYLWDKYLLRGANVEYIRPSTVAEVQRWFATHGKDKKYAYRVLVGGMSQKL